MPIRPFKNIPRDPVEWARYLNQAEVTVDSGSIGADQLADHSVTYLKLQTVAPDRLLGRDTSPAGTVQELTVGGGLEFTGAGIQRSALTGDVTADAGSNTTTIPENTVTYAKIQNVSATDRLLGRQTAGAGDIEEIVCTAAGRDLLDDVNAGAQRTTLGLGTAAVQNIGSSGANVPLLNGNNTWSGGQEFSAPPMVPSYTVATLPSAGTYTAGLIYVSDETGGPVIAFSDGSNWRRVTDRAIVS